MQLEAMMIWTLVARSDLERVILKSCLLRILVVDFSRRHHHDLARACCQIYMLRRAALFAWLRLFWRLEEPGVLV